MPRPLNATQLTEINKLTLNYSYLISIESNVTTRLYHTGSDDFSYAGNNYLADGNIIDIDDFEENIGISYNSQKLILSGANISNYSLVLAEELTNRECVIHLVLNNTAVILLLNGRIQSAGIVNDDVEINVEHRWQNYAYSGGRYNSVESQQQHFPNDDGFIHAAGLDGRVLDWG